MKLNERIDVLVWLGNYMLSAEAGWLAAKERAFSANPWFITQFIDLSVQHIATAFLNKEQLWQAAARYLIPEKTLQPKKTGIVMAGNLPLVGFHDLLCSFLTGHYAFIKPSGKDDILIKHLIDQAKLFNPHCAPYFTPGEMLKGCDAYIATGSNNSSRYFDYYFGKYPHIIRRNRTSVAVLTGEETRDELECLSDDVHLYFGLGCRNVTKLYVPEAYDFVPLLEVFKKWSFFEHHHKYRNNYEHNLAMHILNNRYYMTNGSSILLVEEKALFPPIAQLNYEYYQASSPGNPAIPALVGTNNQIQCIVGNTYLPFGQAQYPSLYNFADGIDTIDFFMNLSL
ncbi:MAG: acyl-CoA reductase [Chitinophagaceae bacterium]